MGKAGINRSLPNNEYQAAINANAPSETNPFLTGDDLSGGIGGSVPMALTSVAEPSGGTASSGIVQDQNILVYQIEGVGGAVNPGSKQALWQFIVPAGYSGNGSIDIVLTTNGPITGFVLSGLVNTVLDPAFNAVDINTTAVHPAFEKQTIPFGVTLNPGDIVTIQLSFSGQNGMDAWVRGLDFNYTINVL
jgi:hypothetical protein